VQYVLRIKCSNVGLYTSKHLNREEDYCHFSSKSTNCGVLRVVGLVSKLNTSCTMFRASNAVIWVFKRRNISIGKRITVIFRQKRRMFAFCGLLVWFGGSIRRALSSARKMQKVGRFNVEIFQSARQLRSFLDKNDECSHCASCWSGFEAQYVLHNVRRLKCRNLGVYTSKYFKR
jgi:hypothetical protein